MSLDNQISPKQGKVTVITGANCGLGYETAVALADNGFTVVLACRNDDKAIAAKQSILRKNPEARIDTLALDLSLLSSVSHAASAIERRYGKINILINNAGIMFPEFELTPDGFESQMATNCFGHFALTSQLIKLMPDTSDSRVVWVSSNAHKTGKINFDDINSITRYNKMAAYSQSKLACLMLSMELDKRLKRGNVKIVSNCSHPGGAITSLSRHMSPFVLKLMKKTILPFITHPVKDAIQPTLFAALHKDARGGKYYGPTGFLEMRGKTGLARVSEMALDQKVSEKLWDLAEEVTDTKFSFSPD